MQMDSGRAAVLHDLANSACDTGLAGEYSRFFGHLPITGPSGRNGETCQMDHSGKARYKERALVGGTFFSLKENYGGSFVRMRCAAEAAAHLMLLGGRADGGLPGAPVQVSQRVSENVGKAGPLGAALHKNGRMPRKYAIRLGWEQSRYRRLGDGIGWNAQ